MQRTGDSQRKINYSDLSQRLCQRDEQLDGENRALICDDREQQHRPRLLPPPSLVPMHIGIRIDTRNMACAGGQGLVVCLSVHAITDTIKKTKTS